MFTFASVYDKNIYEYAECVWENMKRTPGFITRTTSTILFKGRLEELSPERNTMETDSNTSTSTCTTYVYLYFSRNTTMETGILIPQQYMYNPCLSVFFRNTTMETDSNTSTSTCTTYVYLYFSGTPPWRLILIPQQYMYNLCLSVFFRNTTMETDSKPPPVHNTTMETDSNTSTSTSSSRRSIAECVGDMYLDEHLADIHFSFPKEKSIQPVPAHKMILVAKSPVFKAMFCGDLAEKGSTIKITDITAKTFRQMLKHVYTDKLFINADTVGALLHASQKYQLESLTNDCESYLRQNLSLHNACTILQQAADFALFELASSSHNFLCKHATDIISSEDFLNLSKENLKKILECDGFCTDEILIFNGMMKWVDAKIEEEVWTCDPLEKRNSQNSKKRKAERKLKIDAERY
ncbi:BTBD3_6 [Mytilus edulis]|uniref:BTBD3_6 n=1 Tax=Mytilus edulis TaxID=6550 RepID=A0A8S3UKK5_MYTED|nr:BTBD3_6 [Mytilus edulis]